MEVVLSLFLVIHFVHHLRNEKDRAAQAKIPVVPVGVRVKFHRLNAERLKKLRAVCTQTLGVRNRMMKFDSDPELA